MKNTINELLDERFGEFEDRDKLVYMYSNIQTHMALMNMMYTASLLKIDSCAIGGFDKETVEKILLKEGMLDKEEFTIGTTVAFGYRKNEPRPKTRQSFDDVVSYIK